MCNTNTDTTQTRLIIKRYTLARHCSVTHVSAEHNCVKKLDCRVLTHRCAQKELSYCLVEEPIERFCDRLYCAPIAPPTLLSMSPRGVTPDVPAYYAIGDVELSEKRLELFCSVEITVMQGSIKTNSYRQSELPDHRKSDVLL